MAATANTHHAADGEIVVPDTHDIEVRALTVADLKDALKLGYEDFRAKPSYMVVFGLVYPLGAAWVAGYALGADLLPMAFPVVAGLLLLGPFAAIVLYEISRRRELGGEFIWRDIGYVLQRASMWSVFIVIAALVAIFALWILAAQAIFTATIGYNGYLDPFEFLRIVLTTPEGWTLILVGCGVGLIFAAIVLATNVITFPMLLDRRVGAPAAVVTSLRVTLKSPRIVALWGLIIAGSMALGTLFFLVGLGIVVPVLGHASWRLYRKAVAAS
jgi:uncharacterized membrane protein